MLNLVIFLLDFYKSYMQIIYSKDNEKIDIILYNSKTNNKKKGITLIISSLVIIIVGIFLIISSYIHREHFLFLINLISYYIGLCIASFGISSIMYYFYNKKSKLINFICGINRILTPIMFTVNGFLITMEKSHLNLFFENKTIEKTKKFELDALIVGIIMLLFTIGMSVCYFNFKEKIYQFKGIIYYVISVYGILGTNILITSLNKNLRILNLITGIILLPFIIIVSIIAAIFKKIKIEYIVRYYTEFIVSSMSALIIGCMLTVMITEALIVFFNSLNKAFITEKTVIRVIVFLGLIFINGILIWFLKIMFSLKGLRKDNAYRVELKKNLDKLLNQYTLLKYIVLLIATFSLKALDFDMPINQCKDSIQRIETSIDNNKYSNKEINEKKEIIHQYNLKIEEYENSKIYIDSLFYATSLFALLRTVLTVRKEQDKNSETYNLS